MSSILENSKQEDSPTDAVNLALKNIMAGLRELIKEEALTVSQIKAEQDGGDIDFDPFINYQIEQELMEYIIGTLSKIRHVFQLEAHFSDFVIDKMLPTSDGNNKGEI
jgi:hypothetical protein